MDDPPAEIRTFGRSVLAVMEGDITRVAADVIVNAANNAFAAGGGVDGAIRKAAGPELSGEMRQRYPPAHRPGTAVATGACGCPARWVIHAVGPVWGRGGQDRARSPRSAYRSVMRVADELGATTLFRRRSSAGTFGFPIETAADVALRTVRDYLLGETGIERVTFVLRPSGIEIVPAAAGHHLSRASAGQRPSNSRAAADEPRWLRVQRLGDGDRPIAREATVTFQEWPRWHSCSWPSS